MTKIFEWLTYFYLDSSLEYVHDVNQPFIANIIISLFIFILFVRGCRAFFGIHCRMRVGVLAFLHSIKTKIVFIFSNKRFFEDFYTFLNLFATLLRRYRLQIIIIIIIILSDKLVFIIFYLSVGKILD